MSPAPEAPHRRRAALELAGLAALLVLEAVLQRARGGLDLGLLALAASLAGPALRRGLVAWGKLGPPRTWTLALEAGALLVVVALGRSGEPGSAVLAGLAVLSACFAPGEPARDSRGERAGPLARASALVLVLALGPPLLVPLASGFDSERFEAMARALVPLGVLALEALGPGADRSVAAAARRASAAGLVGASALFSGFDPWHTGAAAPATWLAAFAWIAALATATRLAPNARTLAALALFAAHLVAQGFLHPEIDLELVLVVGTALALGTSGADSLARPARVAVLAAVLALALLRPIDRAPNALVSELGLAAGALAVLALAALAFLAVALGWRPTGRPGKPALVGATAVALVFALEGGLRIRRSERFDVALADLVPLTISSGTASFGRATTPLDLRAKAFSPSKAEGVYRVVLLGGSTAWGHAQKERATSYTGRLEARAPRLGGKRAEVLCLAFPGGTSDHELAILGAHALAWQPDLVLAVDGYNDMAYLSGKDAYPGDFYAWPQQRLGLASPFARALVRRSALLGPLVARTVTLAPVSTPARFRPGTANGFYEEGLAANEEAMAILAREAGARFAWGFVPLLEDRVARAPGEPEPPEHAPEALRRRAAAVARVSPLIVNAGGVVLDLAGRFAARSATPPLEPWFVDECHSSDRGADVLAEETWAALLAAGVVPP